MQKVAQIKLLRGINEYKVISLQENDNTHTAMSTINP